MVHTVGKVSSSPFFTSKLITKNPTSINFLPSLGVICFEGRKPSSLQIPGFPNKLLTEVGNQHEREQTHHHCAWDHHHRLQKTQNPWLSFLAQKTRREELLPKALGKKLHATFLPSPPFHSYWESSSSDNIEVRIRMLFTTSVVNETLLQLC